MRNISQRLGGIFFTVPHLPGRATDTIKEPTVQDSVDEILAEWLERLTANAVVATILGSIPVTSDTVESEGRQMKQC